MQKKAYNPICPTFVPFASSRYKIGFLQEIIGYGFLEHDFFTYPGKSIHYIAKSTQ